MDICIVYAVFVYFWVDIYNLKRKDSAPHLKKKYTTTQNYTKDSNTKTKKTIGNALYSLRCVLW